jgi:hypothetical protein
MQPQQWILFGLGILLIIFGTGLVLWANVQKKARAGVIQDTASLIHQIANLFGAMGNFFGPDAAVRAGAFLMIFGGALVVGAFVIPISRT